MVNDSQTLCRALGYDLNTVEFAVEDGIPYAIDFLNPAPDADIHSVGQANFDWIVNAVAEMAVAKALSDENPARSCTGRRFCRVESRRKLPKAKAQPKRKRRPNRRSFANFAAFLCALCGQEL